MAKTNRVTAYQATDGALFLDKAEYQAHQKALNLLFGLKQVANRIEGDPRYLCDDAVPNCYLLDSNDLADFLLENAEDIKLALDGKLTLAATEHSDVEKNLAANVAVLADHAAQVGTVAGSEVLAELAEESQKLGLYDKAEG